MLRPAIITCALLLQGACATSPFHEGNRFETTVMASVARRCADNDFEPVDVQRALGLEADIRYPRDDVGLELSLFHSSDEGTNDVAGLGAVDVDASMTEFGAGGRWQYGDWILGSRPYAAGGVALLFVSASSAVPGSSRESDSDWTIGPYVRFGIAWPIVGGLSIALDYRQVMFTDWFRDIDLDGMRTDANYSQVGIVVGWTF